MRNIILMTLLNIKYSWRLRQVVFPNQLLSWKISSLSIGLILQETHPLEAQIVHRKIGIRLKNPKGLPGKNRGLKNGFPRRKVVLICLIHIKTFRLWGEIQVENLTMILEILWKTKELQEMEKLLTFILTKHTEIVRCTSLPTKQTI